MGQHDDILAKPSPACLPAFPPVLSCPVLLEDNFVAGLQDIFEAKTMFKRMPGLKIAFPRPDGVAAHMARRVEPVGTTPTTASTAEPSMLRWIRWIRWRRLAAIGARHMDESPMLRLQRFAKLGTMDL